MKSVHYTVHREGNAYIAQCLDYDVSSLGSTELEALRNLKEAVELHLEVSPDSRRVPRISEMRFGELAIA